MVTTNTLALVFTVMLLLGTVSALLIAAHIFSARNTRRVLRLLSRFATAHNATLQTDGSLFNTTLSFTSPHAVITLSIRPGIPRKHYTELITTISIRTKTHNSTSTHKGTSIITDTLLAHFDNIATADTTTSE
jgi:hypothetical protein